MSSFVFCFGTKKVLAYGSWYLSSTHYNIEVSQADSVGTQLILSWAPKNASNSRYSDLVTIKYVGNNTRSFNLLLYGEGTQQVTIATDSITSVTLTTNSSYNSNISSELYLLNTYLPDINDILTNTTDLSIDVQAILDRVNSINSEENAIKLLLLDFKTILENGISLNNYDLDLKQVAIYSYFASHGGTVQTDTNNFLSSDALFLDYPIMKGYNNPTSADSNYLTAYADMEYIFVFALNTSTQMVQDNRMSLIYRSGDYSTFNITYRTQKSYGNTLHVSAFKGYSNKDGANSNNSAFVLNFTLNRFDTYQYIPLYWGPIKYCPNYIFDLIQVDNPNLGEEEATNTIDSLDDSNDAFNSQVSDIDDIQNDLEDDFKTNIQAINTDLDFEASFGQKFVTSAQWVRTQFETLTTQTPYGSILFFALTLGLALTIIGRVI